MEIRKVFLNARRPSIPIPIHLSRSLKLEPGTYVALLVTKAGTLEVKRLDEHYADERARAGRPPRRD